MGSLTPSSKAWPQKVAMAYIFGVNNGSTPMLDRRKRGIEADIKVDTVECKIVIGAIENGIVQLGRLRRFASMDRGG